MFSLSSTKFPFEFKISIYLKIIQTACCIASSSAKVMWKTTWWMYSDFLLLDCWKTLRYVYYEYQYSLNLFGSVLLLWTFNLYCYNCLVIECSQCFFNLSSQGQGLTAWHMVSHVVSVRLSRLRPSVKCSVIINCFETFQADSHLISASNNENVNCFNFCLQETVPTEYYSQRICHHSWGFHSRWVRF